MEKTSCTQKLSLVIDRCICSVQKKLEAPPTTKNYTLYGKSIFLPMLSISIFILALFLLLTTKLLLMPFLYYRGGKDGTD